MSTVPQQALSPIAKRPKPPLVFWKPVIATAITSLVFVAGFVIVMRHFPTAAHARAHKPKPALSTALPVLASGTNTSVDPDAIVTITLPPQPRPDVRFETIQDAAVPVSQLLDGEKPVECKACAAARAQTSGPSGGRYGTQVDFIDDPIEAARMALDQKKLLFVLHIAGNFEDNAFT
jgi:hypothetical protein